MRFYLFPPSEGFSRNWWGKVGFRARVSRPDGREGGVLGKPPAVGAKGSRNPFKTQVAAGIYLLDGTYTFIYLAGNQPARGYP